MTVIWEPSYSEDARRWRAIATDLTTREFAARAAEIDQNQRYPVENEALLRSSGIASMFLPRSHGGGGASLEAFGAVVEAIAYGCASTSGIVATLQLGALPVLLAGSDEIKRKYLTFSADGRGKTISFALSERNAGSDPARLETRATPDGDDWLIQGEKCWIGNGSNCDAYVVFAQTKPGSGSRGIAAFVVDKDTPGLKDDQREDKMGMRGTVNAVVQLDCRVSGDQMLAPPGEALKLALKTLNVGRISVAFQSSGLACAAFDAAADHSVTRETFGKRLIDHQALSFRLANLATRISAGRMLAVEAARAYDRGQNVVTIGAQAKLFCSESAHEAADLGVQMLGGQGYVKPSIVERIYRDQKATEIYEGTSEIQRVVLGRAIKSEYLERAQETCKKAI
ncbi:acyl-CoA dehydrogenase family protein [Roseovarius sp.]|uniref:acyl-CoA dehydrogenase family protein n=1 Tax=Roseovarius sp. TaxID=1486281 RepID=UPI0026360F75|nr:acyl-CoA dehydrogenase family protein [Roseovarius sp.]MDM8165681.1 acyl-CoA dehydrogenase family protein [Roseovarius sp.]